MEACLTRRRLAMKQHAARKFKLGTQRIITSTRREVDGNSMCNWNRREISHSTSRPIHRNESEMQKRRLAPFEMTVSCFGRSKERFVPPIAESDNYSGMEKS